MNVKWEDSILNDIDKYYRLAFCYVKNYQDANDIIQESLYKALKNQNNLKNKGAVRTWFYRIVVNTSLDYLKKSSKVINFNNNDWENIPDDNKYEDLDLKDAVNNLPFKYKTVIVLRYFEDMKISEIANILNENENTVKSRIYKALKKLKIKLEEEV